MFNFAALVAFVSLAISVSGAPLEIRQEVSNAAITNARLSTVNKTSIKQKAAAYFITNEDTGNFVVVMDINTEDGKLVCILSITVGLPVSIPVTDIGASHLNRWIREPWAGQRP